MGKINIRYIVAFIMIAVGAVVVNLIEYETFYQADDAIQTVSKIPAVLGNWRGTDVVLTEDVYDILETRAIIHRSYQYRDQRVFLSLVFYPETKVDFHAPEACLAGGGREIKKSAKTIMLENAGKNISLDLNQLIYSGELNKELVYYFFKTGSYMGNSYIHLRFSLAGNKLSGNGTSGSLIRISTSDKTIDSVNAADRLKHFIQDLYPYLIEFI